MIGNAAVWAIKSALLLCPRCSAGDRVDAPRAGDAYVMLQPRKLIAATPYTPTATEAKIGPGQVHVTRATMLNGRKPLNWLVYSTDIRPWGTVGCKTKLCRKWTSSGGSSERNSRNRRVTGCSTLSKW